MLRRVRGFKKFNSVRLRQVVETGFKPVSTTDIYKLAHRVMSEVF